MLLLRGGLASKGLSPVCALNHAAGQLVSGADSSEALAASLGPKDSVLQP